MTENSDDLLDGVLSDEQSRGPSDDQLREVSRLAERQTELEGEIADLEDKLKARRQDLNQVRMVDLPEAMRSAGVNGLTLNDGSQLVVEEGVDAHVAKKNLDTAVQWLEDHGYGDLPKRRVGVSVGRDQEASQRAVEALREQGLDPEQNTELHPQTVKAFVKERFREGDNLPPEDVFGVYHYRKSVVRRQK